MLEKNYNNLYEARIYKKESRLNFQDKDTERLYALANAIYVISKNCIALSSSDPLKASVIISDDDNSIINNILEEEPDVMGVLYDIKGPDESKKQTMVDATIMVCEAHLNREKRR